MQSSDFSQNDESPLLFQTDEGFSVKYKNRFLYSKYSPKKSILKAIENLNILPGTLILSISPCLGYGLEELLEKIGEESFIFCIEKDETLYNFSKNQCASLKCVKTAKNVFFVEPAILNNLPILINARGNFFSKFRGKIKRVIRIDFSAASSFNHSFYNEFTIAMQDAASQFWKNRITLVKFGKKYSINLFRNLCCFENGRDCFDSRKDSTLAMTNSNDIATLFGTVDKPILVFGAGESIENIFLQHKNDCHFFDNFFIIAVDATLPALKKIKLHVNAVVSDEAQVVIEKAFIGCKNYADFSFTSLSSNRISRCSGKKHFYYTTIYDDAIFIKQMQEKNLLPFAFPPLGSVGLTATKIALLLRKKDEIPVFVSGLDFSYSVGKTHAKGTFPHLSRLEKTIRLSPIENYAAAFGEGAFFFKNEKGKKIVTTKLLHSYSELYRKVISDKCQVISDKLADKQWTVDRGQWTVDSYGDSRLAMTGVDKQNCNDIFEFISAEISALNELKNVLSNGQKMSENERNKKITELLECREYLYLHFPDGYNFNLSPAFLKRVRAEIDVFLKVLKKIDEKDRWNF